jgi:hypothetical protein
MAGPQSHRFDIRKLNLLFYTKTAVPRCDITGLPAAVELVTPYLTVVRTVHSHDEYMGLAECTYARVHAT